MHDLSTPAVSETFRRFVQHAIRTEAPVLATPLATYASRMEVTWSEIAHLLGCTEEQLDCVACCTLPRDELYASDVDSIAAGFCDATALINLLRTIDSLNAFAKPDQVLSGSQPIPEHHWPAAMTVSQSRRKYKLAARDREVADQADVGEQIANPPQSGSAGHTSESDTDGS